MGIDELISILWRRRTVFGLAAGISILAVIVVTLAVPKTYQATATIFVGQSIEGDLASQTLDSTQGEQLARTFTTLATSPSIAEIAGSQLDEPLSRTELLDRMSVSPVERTQLLEINAEGSSPEEAADIANTYAAVFVREMSKLHEQGRVPTTVALSAEAVPPTEPAKPNVPLYIGFGVMLSLLLAAGVALMRDRLDRTIRISEDEDSLLGQPILARIPSAAATLALPIHRRVAREQLADSLRVLRTNIELAPGEKARSVLITSARVSEGKTTVARELALTIASDGDSVVLVELDLRRPTLDLGTTGTGIHRDEIGVAEVLASRRPLDDALQESAELPGLAVMQSGTLGANPTRLLRSPQTSAVLGELRTRYDWVIVDSPPLLVADDVLLLTPHLDASALVVDTTSGSLSALRSAINRLHKVDARLLGLILNKTAPEPNPYYQPQGYKPGRSGNGGGRPSGERRERARS